MGIDFQQLGWAALGYGVAFTLISLLVLWLIIYTAVRAATGAALRAHQDDLNFQQVTRADRESRGQHADLS
ncbi:hypothetical protein [Microbacterium dauci]|uniref:Heme exporter protein D n=1 Tax=Microbacterium dauci TaxID=3048008 RepID=A0ABT6ZGT2_9MICO|nr:hypothetical protein [Microbacterium sp. LX3-4]MDJ1115354.1 hypothetical protein [Microbacterium sp. LX3-4]